MNLFTLMIAIWAVWAVAMAVMMTLGFKEIRPTLQRHPLGRSAEYHRYSRWVGRRLRSSAYGRSGRRECAVMWASRLEWTTRWMVLALWLVFILSPIRN